MARELQNVEIFATGTWHPSGGKVTITEADLDEMIASFTALGSVPGFTPVLKLGHTDAQKWFGQKNGAPALGFVSKIWKEGGKILANFSNVPDAIVDMISARRYNSVSVEIFPRYEHGGQTLKNVLYAVALLGAELPAVKGLKELAASLFNAQEAFSAGDLVTYTREAEGDTHMTVQFSQEQHDALVIAAVTKATDAAKAEFAAEIEALKGSIETLTADVTRLTGERDTAVSALRTYEADVEKREFETMIEAAVAAGKLTPAQKPMAVAFAESLKGSIKFGDGEKPAKVLFKEFLDGFKAVDTSEKGTSGSKTTTDFASAGLEVDTKAKALITEGKAKTYAEARSAVLAADADLKARYFGE